MKTTRILLIASFTLAGLALQACGGGGYSGGGNRSPNGQSQSLNTQQVLAIARTTSETAAPFAVSDGAASIVGTDETSDPISIN